MTLVLLTFLSVLINSATAFLPRNSFPSLPVHHRFKATASAQDCTLSEAEDDASPVLLKDLKTGRTIECYVHSLAKLSGDDSQYVVAVPCDPCGEALFGFYL